MSSENNPTTTTAGPKITEQEVIRKTGIACDRIRQQVKSCMKKSECVQVKRLKASTCLDNHDLPDKCFQLLEMLLQCRRIMEEQKAKVRANNV